MAAIALAQRDLALTREQLSKWFERKLGHPVALSQLRPANRAAGWSSETLSFTVTGGGSSTDYVVRIPPSGGGMFRVYDLEAQTRTQDLLLSFDIPTPSPSHFERDVTWIGTEFMVMPRIVGHTPSDTTYAIRGWLHDAGADVQRRANDSFLQTLADLRRIPIDRVPWLKRPEGIGNTAELCWWSDYLAWGADGKVPDVMTKAFEWLRNHQPDESESTVCWGDARLSNAIFDDAGEIVGALDWEQACLCPAETDLAWWLATRRQAMEMTGNRADPELPGFDGRDQLVGRFEEMIGRRLIDLSWYENFSMVRMGCCILRTQSLLTQTGQTEHGFMRAPILPKWTVAAIGL